MNDGGLEGSGMGISDSVLPGIEGFVDDGLTEGGKLGSIDASRDGLIELLGRELGASDEPTEGTKLRNGVQNGVVNGSLEGNVLPCDEGAFFVAFLIAQRLVVMSCTRQFTGERAWQCNGGRTPFFAWRVCG
jgi:hypothetical protein